MRGMNTVVKGLVVAAAVAMSGCASNATVEEAKKGADEAKAAAAAAQQAAAKAQSTADKAAADAAAAMRKADEANACCRDNAQKFDRMFKKSMNK